MLLAKMRMTFAKHRRGGYGSILQVDGYPAARGAMRIILPMAPAAPAAPVVLFGSTPSASDGCVGWYAPARSAFRRAFETADLAMHR